MTQRLVFELARRDHDRHLGLIEVVLRAPSATERIDGSVRLGADLRCHSRSEQTALVGVLLADPRARPLARRAVLLHLSLKRMLADVSARVHDASALRAATLAYRERFAEYVRFEEEELYPVALVALGVDRCARLCRRYEFASRQHVARFDDHMLAR